MSYLHVKTSIFVIVFTSLHLGYAQAPTYTITYTGRLFGYFRSPEVQEIKLDQATEVGCKYGAPIGAPIPESSEEKEAYGPQTSAMMQILSPQCVGPWRVLIMGTSRFLGDGSRR